MIQTLTRLTEHVAHKGALSVDESAGVIRGVRVLGLESANGRTYLAEAVSKALKLYEGKQINVDHPSRPGEAVGVARRIGWLESVRVDPDGGLRADLCLLKSHPMAPAVMEAARRRPQLMGLSHNASGRTRREGGREIVESIEAVHSVDLVADPASVAGLSEGRTMKRMKISALIESCKCQRPGYARALKEVAEAGIMGSDDEMDMPAEPAAPPSEGGDHEQALLDAAKAVLDDSALSSAEKLAKIKGILKLVDGGGSGGGSSDSESKDTEEGLKLENSALRQLAAKGIRLTKLTEMALKGCRTEADVKALVEDLEKSGGHTGGARSAAGWHGNGTPPPGKGGSDKKITEGKNTPPEGDAAARRKWLTS